VIETVKMYRVRCDADGCDASPQDDGDFYAWASSDSAMDEATDCDWYVVDSATFCREHAPKCVEPGCDLELRDAEWGSFCEDHADRKPGPGQLALDCSEVAP
jgi:hypothetical protein